MLAAVLPFLFSEIKISSKFILVLVCWVNFHGDNDGFCNRLISDCKANPAASEVKDLCVVVDRAEMVLRLSWSVFSRAWADAVQVWGVLTSLSWAFSPQEWISTSRLQWVYCFALQAGKEFFPIDDKGNILTSKYTFLDAWEVSSGFFKVCSRRKNCQIPIDSTLGWQPTCLVYDLITGLSNSLITLSSPPDGLGFCMTPFTFFRIRLRSKWGRKYSASKFDINMLY